MINFSIAIKCTYSSTKQNNKTTKSSSEKEGSMNTMSLEVGDGKVMEIAHWEDGAGGEERDGEGEPQALSSQ